MSLIHVRTENEIRLACRHVPSQTGVTYVWLPGFRGDMNGTKVTALTTWAKRAGHGLVAFDYSGHGLSGGKFADGTIGSWRRDALNVIRAVTDGPLILVGSSMGAWIALLVALVLKKRVVGMVLLAPAPDFTRSLMWPTLDQTVQDEITRQGFSMVNDPDADPWPLTRALFEDGRTWCLLDGPIELDMPVRILHGLDDDVVPWRHALKLAGALRGDDVTLTLLKGGDHRLSRPGDMAGLSVLCASLADVAGD